MSAMSTGIYQALGMHLETSLVLPELIQAAPPVERESLVQVGEQLPPLNRDGDGGQALNQYLRRRAVWMALRDDAKKQGEQLTPYSFRHRFAKGMHAANIPIANISEAMGHTIEVHLKSYARFKPNALLI